MTKRGTVLLGTIAVAVALAWALHRQGRTDACGVAAAKHQWEVMARVCEEAYRRTGDVEAASRTLMGLSALSRTAEVDRHLSWLEGTRLAPAATYYRALVAQANGDDAAATRLFAEALRSSQDAGLREYGALSAHQLASNQWALGQFQAAFTSLDTAFEEARQFDDQLLLMNLEGQLADLLGEVGDLSSQAQALHSVAQRARGQPWTMAQIRLRQGLVEVERDNLLLARDYFAEALDTAADAGLTPIVRAAHINLASLCRKEGDLDGGEMHLEAAAEIPAQFGYDDSTWAYARAELLRDRGDWAGARRVIEGALDAGPLPDWHWQLLTLQGSCAEAQGDTAEAARSFFEATRVIEHLRTESSTEALRPGLVAVRREPYEARFELSMKAGETDAALEVMEQLFARGFLETLARPTAGGFDDLVSARRVAQHRLAALETMSARRRPVVPMGSLLEGLGDREVLGFLVARGTVYRAHASARGVTFARVERLERVRELLEALAAHPDELAHAEALGQLLWPAEPVATRVVVVTDGPLANLSFAGLRRNGRWLVEGHVISRASSMASAAAASEGHASGSRLLRLLGDPKGDLPSAAREVRALARQLGAQAMVGTHATRAELLASCHADLLHFAGHSGLGPEGGWLALSDGEVTTADLLSAQCAPRLVFLASCASGVSRSQGAGTLAEAFLAAGAGHVVATTRSVDDPIAAAFTREFFADGAFDRPVERLAQTQRRLSLAHRRSDWEPFVVLGP